MIEPELWGKNNDITTMANIEYLKKFKPLIEWKQNESILEFGIGDGRTTRDAMLPLLPEDFKEYIGTDISHQMVNYVKTTISDPKVKFMVFDISSKDIPKEFENRFDHIFGFFVMHWIQNTRQAFQNMFKMMKPGGQLFLTLVEETCVDSIYFDFCKSSKWGKYHHERLISPYFNHPDPPNEYKKHLNEVGFKTIEYQTGRRAYTFPSEESFIGFCLSVNPILKEVSEEDFNEYKKEYLTKMANNKLNFTTKCPRTGKIIYHSSYELNVVLARK